MINKYADISKPITKFTCDEINGKIIVEKSSDKGGYEKYIPEVTRLANKFYKGGN